MILIALIIAIWRILLSFIYWKKIQKIFYQYQLIIITLDGNLFLSKILKPTYIILNPLTELKNWFPAPIPQYSPPPLYPVIKVNDLSPIPDSCIEDSNPEYQTVINILTNALVFKNGNIATYNFFYKNVIELPFTGEMDSKINEFNIRRYETIEQAIPFFHPYLTCYYHFLIEVFTLLLIYDQITIQNSVLIHNCLPKKIFNELCSILNLKFKKTLCVGTPVFVKKLFIPIPHRFDECDINSVRHFRHLMLMKCDVKNLEATQNVYYNRPKNRLILNFNELK